MAQDNVNLGNASGDSQRSSSAGGRSLVLTGLFPSIDAAEHAYRSALALGYEQSDVNIVMTEETRRHLQSTRSGRSELAQDAMRGTSDTEQSELGGPKGVTLGIIAPVLAAVGSLALLPGLIIAGPVAAALTAAGAVGLAGGLVGALADWGIPKERSSDYESGIRKGGILLGVSTRSKEDAERLASEWRSHGGLAVHY